MSRLTKEAQRRQIAREQVNALVRDGTIPHPRDSSCFDCRGQACQYDHHRGYDGDAILDVQPVCIPCHVKRGRARAELPGRPRRPAEPRKGVVLPFSAVLIRRTLLARGVGPGELAKQLGVSGATVSGWLHGRHEPRVVMLMRLCEVLGLSMSEFFPDEHSTH